MTQDKSRFEIECGHASTPGCPDHRFDFLLSEPGAMRQRSECNLLKAVTPAHLI
jgi:hypothetical protein